MDTEMIRNKYQELNRELNIALGTMERSDTIKELRREMLALQNICPHKHADGTFARNENDRCIFCGKVIE